MLNMSIEETYKGMWSSDPFLLKSLLDAGETIITNSGYLTWCDGGYWLGAPIGPIPKRYDSGLPLGFNFLIPPHPLVLEPKPLEWHHRDMNEEAFASYGDWSFYAWHDGDWEILYDVDRIGGGETKDGNFDTAKAAIQEWRVNHIKSMLP